jgi:hypothetical protein
MAIARELHRRWPALSFDVTIKISHLIAHGALLAELASLGCAFVVSAVESLDDGVLARLDKGHTRADFERALALTTGAGLVLRPTFVPFTPWTTLDQIADLVEFLAEDDLIGCVDPVQLSVRLLVPPGSLLLGPETRDAFDELDGAALSYQWTHSDPRVDRLQHEIAAIAAAAAGSKLDPDIVFARIRERGIFSVTTSRRTDCRQHQAAGPRHRDWASRSSVKEPLARQFGSLDTRHGL